MRKSVNACSERRLKVSVVTPSYNQGEFLERTLLSVLAQTAVDLEYIVVDGVSRDASLSVIERYAASLDCVLIEPDDGQADALRKGFALATGDVLCYLNSDDVLTSGSLAFVVDFFENNPDVDAIYGNRLFLSPDDRLTGVWVLPPHSDYLMARWDFIPQEGCFWRRRLMERSGSINPSFAFALDYDLFVRMMKKGRFVHVDRFLAGFRVHPASKSSTQYETVGRSEVARVREEQGIRMRWYDAFVKYLFGATVLGRSFLYYRMNRKRLERSCGFGY